MIPSSPVVYTPGDRGLLEAGFAALEQGVTVHDREARVVACNPAAARMIGAPLDEILGDRPLYRAAATPAGDPLLRVLGTGQAESDVVVELRAAAAARSVWLRASFRPLLSESQPEVVGVVASFSEIDTPVLGSAGQPVIETTVELAPEALVVFDDRGMVTLANRAARELAGRTPQLAAAIRRERPLRAVLEHARSPGETAEDRPEQCAAFTCVFESPGSETRWVAVQLSALPASGGESVCTVCSLRDISAQRRREAELTHHALHDPLTGLPNLRLVREHFTVALARARRGEQAVGLLFLDVNGLKRVNDNLGHHAGDALLIEFANRLTGAVRACDPVGRIGESPSLVGRKGGDEFVVILTDLASDPRNVMQKVTARLEVALQQPLMHCGHEIQLSAEIGGAAYPCDGSDAESLLERANAAMRKAKRPNWDSRTER